MQMMSERMNQGQWRRQINSMSVMLSELSGVIRRMAELTLDFVVAMFFNLNDNLSDNLNDMYYFAMFQMSRPTDMTEENIPSQKPGV